ncbi:glycoside hydrolase family 95 protein [Microbispora sp. RL4-1S]|uniref:Glycoside hydrolase family 95 protein n=1 Tax=Microbispora oryzae TaxID=2806554 RepID=A0A941ASL9_9ACTN|nr:glycoside hydrolase family 95 protein [Microbispora oryzae]MBP2708659.1 glycoside hydrolase family 95 protein [Microbispora oryzae]
MSEYTRRGVPGSPSLPGALGPNPMTLWYRRPATQWLEALPIGCGRLGGMVFGGVANERIQLNEDSVWAGGPHVHGNARGADARTRIRDLVWRDEWSEARDRAEHTPADRPAYQILGDLRLTFPGAGEFTDYRRELDLTSAVTTVTYMTNGVRHTREMFASHADQVIVVHLTADRPGAVSFQATLTSPQESSVSSTDSRTIALDGVSGHSQERPGEVAFRALARAGATRGTVRSEAGTLIVEGADDATLLISMGTSYRSYQDVGGDPAEVAGEHLTRASDRPFAVLRSAHVRDYRELFGRVELDLGTTETAALPTDERVARRCLDDDPQLAALFFAYGRYLLISSSRSPGQPANLQGIWNDTLTPAWQSWHTTNVNMEMNYWPAAPANLIECYDPLFDLIADLSESALRPGATSYGTGGWRGTTSVDAAFYGMWPSGGAWLTLAFWERYLFTGDEKSLREHFPIIKGAVRFFLDALRADPSTAPESEHHVGGGTTVALCAGPGTDTPLLRDLFDAYVEASRIVGDEDEKTRDDVARARDELASVQVGGQGRIQEWLEEHRRGDADRGWSLAWKINLWARLLEPAEAYQRLGDLLLPDSTAPNMFGLHPPFQIDANFGGTSGITEMLLQSHGGEVSLLPALPAAWATGRFRGLLARGGFRVDLEWRDGDVHEGVITSTLGGPLRLRTPRDVRIESGGRRLDVRRPEPGVAVVGTDCDTEYRITPV